MSNYPDHPTDYPWWRYPALNALGATTLAGFAICLLWLQGFACRSIEPAWTEAAIHLPSELPSQINARPAPVATPAAQLCAGQELCLSADGGRWLEVPAQLAGAKFVQNSHGYQESHRVRVSENATEADGERVLLAVLFNPAGNGDWRARSQSLEQLSANGWCDTGLRLKSEYRGAIYDWTVLERSCRRGESLAIRTAKYTAPIRVIP